MNKIDLLKGLMLTVLIIGMFAFAGHVHTTHYKQTEDYCNNLYGIKCFSQDQPA